MTNSARTKGRVYQLLRTEQTVIYVGIRISSATTPAAKGMQEVAIGGFFSSYQRCNQLNNNDIIST